MSRINAVNVIRDVNLNLSERDIAIEQQTDVDLDKIINSKSLNVKWINIDDNLKLLCDYSLSEPRVFLPKRFRKSLFDRLHALAHSGIKASIKLMNKNFIWPNLAKDVREWARACHDCQRNKVNKNYNVLPQFFPEVKDKFKHIHIDLTGPFPPNKGFKYLLTIIDRFTRWPEAVPLVTTKTEDIMDALIHHWIAKYGVPTHITSDRGPQFTSQIWRALAEVLGVEMNFTTPYHPQANGLVERFHRTLKSSLLSSADDRTWLAKLPWTMLGLRSAVKLSSGKTPGEVTFGTNLNLPGTYQENAPKIFNMDKFPKFMAEKIESGFKGITSPRFRHNIDKEKFLEEVPFQLKTAKFVYIKDKRITSSFKSPYQGPFEVIKKFSKFFLLKIGRERRKISVDRLKPAFSSTNHHQQ